MRVRALLICALWVVAASGQVLAEEASLPPLAEQQSALELELLISSSAPAPVALAATYTIDDLLGTNILCSGPGAPCRSNTACCDGFCAKVSTYGWCL